jgi:hypothetical protein
MNEDFLQLIWKNRWFDDKVYLTRSGKKVRILHPGYLNDSSGPDFFNARILIDEVQWAGNAEIHVKSSDWNAHKHQHDAAYNNVILHIVDNDDIDVFNSKNAEVCTIAISYPPEYSRNLNQLLSSNDKLACNQYINQIDNIHLKQWFSRMASERLAERSEAISALLTEFRNDWEQAFYIFLFRSFGFGANAQAFEQLARSLPVSIVSKHYDHLIQVEALLFGQSGLLEEPYIDDYQQLLGKEYKILQAKFNLSPIEAHLWKFMRLRPNNFPTLRLSQLSALLNRSPRMLAQILKFDNADSIVSFLKVSASAYWNSHFVFGKTQSPTHKHLGDDSAKLIIINTIIPFIFAYGKYKNNELLNDRALQFLESTEAEKNTITESWKQAGFKASSALETQAMLCLNRNYCVKRRCSCCDIGARIILKSNKNAQN